MRQQQFILDGEAVVLGVDGLSDFDALQSRRHDDEVQLYAFDCLALGGDGLSRLPLFMRKTTLAQLEKDPQRHPWSGKSFRHGQNEQSHPIG
ncbi:MULTISPECIES: ATP-dependent DNA ligase [unclassified Bradyrhizobium]|uniref:ATP-dependent DNA ligase n=1 Tax=unclassified Bradyrhizobium TaxID=2631580 RepID=UPI002FE2B54D